MDMISKIERDWGIQLAFSFRFAIMGNYEFWKYQKQKKDVQCKF